MNRDQVPISPIHVPSGGFFNNSEVSNRSEITEYSLHSSSTSGRSSHSEIQSAASSLAGSVMKSDPRGFAKLTQFLKDLFCRSDSAIDVVDFSEKKLVSSSVIGDRVFDHLSSKSFNEQSFVKSYCSSYKIDSVESVQSFGSNDEINYVNDLLFPDGGIGHFKQGLLGSCWILSSMHAVDQFDKNLLKNLIKIDTEKKGVNFYFYSLSEQKISNSEKNDGSFLRLIDGFEGGVSGNFGAKLFERAIGHIFLEKDKKSANDEIHSQPRTFRRIDKGGRSYPVLSALLNPNDFQVRLFSAEGKVKGFASEDSVCKKESVFEALDYLADHKQSSLATAENDIKEQSEREPSVTLYDNHAYAVAEVNKETRQVSLVNPHDTSKPVWVSYDQFVRCFGDLVIASKDKTGLAALQGN